MKKFFIPSYDNTLRPQYAGFFVKNGWRATTKILDADLILFTGGEDVSPELYGEVNLYSHNNKKRDKYEGDIWEYVQKITPRPITVGICRGGQFLNVMNGGSLWQDVNNHLSTHPVVTKRGQIFDVTSTHHQMMIPAKSGEVILHAGGRASRLKNDKIEYSRQHVEEPDTEAVVYKGTRTLCFQPHPEFEDASKRLVEFFFETIEGL